jgi:spore maturation protein B
MPVSALIIPLLIVFLLIYGVVKRANCYDCFIRGAKGSIDLVVSIFPYLVAIFVAVGLMKASGLTALLSIIMSPIFSLLQIPPELAELILIRPFSGSGSLAILENIYTQYGADSYIARCASTIIGCSDSVFYIATIYLSQTRVKKLGVAIPIALFATLIGVVLSCLLCKLI